MGRIIGQLSSRKFQEEAVKSIVMRELRVEAGCQKVSLARGDNSVRVVLMGR